MFGITVVTPPAAAPLTPAELRAHLRLNTTIEDGLLAEWIATAVARFESATRRPVLATVYRQSFAAWPWDRHIALMRGGVTEVLGVHRATAGAPEALAGWGANLETPPARVRLPYLPLTAYDAAGDAVEPAGWVEFRAGWANAAAVPKDVRTGLKLLAAHYYRRRDAFADAPARETPEGWAALVAPYRLGLSGDWGQ